MDKERVISMLKAYPRNKARCEMLKVENQELSMLLQEMRQTQVEDMLLVGKGISGMPSGGSVGDPTGKLALLLADGGESEPVRQIMQEMENNQRELARLRASVDYVDIWLDALNPKEREVVKGKFFDGETWAEIANRLERSFGIGYTRNTIRTIAGTAMQKILDIVG